MQPKPALVPVPSLDRLFTMHKHPSPQREQELRDLLRRAIQSRGIAIGSIATHFGHKHPYYNDRFGNYPRVKLDVSFWDVCEVLTYLKEFDQQARVDAQKEPL
jgi:hypothetical protein